MLVEVVFVGGEFTPLTFTTIFAPVFKSTDVLKKKLILGFELSTAQLPELGEPLLTVYVQVNPEFPVTKFFVLRLLQLEEYPIVK